MAKVPKEFYETRQDEVAAALCFALGSDTMQEEESEEVQTLELELTPLAQLVLERHERAIEFIVKRMRYDVNEKLANSRTAIFIAAEYGYTDIVSLLIECGANYKEKDLWGMTPLHVASYYRQTDTVELLLKKNADIHAYSKVMGTPIISAVCKWRYARREGTDPCATVQLLIKHGANVNDKMKNNGMTPLMFAVLEQNVKLVDLLVQANANTNDYLTANCISDTNPDEQGSTILSYAFCNGPDELIRTLLKAKDLDVNQTVKQCRLLHGACRIGNLEFVKSLVNRGADINALSTAVRNTTPLYSSLLSGHLHIAEYLLEQKDINVNQQKSEDLVSHPAILFNAIHKKQFPQDRVDKIIKKIIDKTDDIDKGGDQRLTPLANALIARNIPIIKYLVAKGARVNLTAEQKRLNGIAPSIWSIERDDVYLYSPLQMACKVKGYISIVKLFLSKGAEVNCYDENINLQPLSFAIWTGDYEIVRELISNKAKVFFEYVQQNKSQITTEINENELTERKKINFILRQNLR